MKSNCATARAIRIVITRWHLAGCLLMLSCDNAA